MAKPKEKQSQLSAAFQEKCIKETDKLRKKLALQLKADIERMLEEDIHSDLEFRLKGGYSVGHRLILKARSRNLWERLCEGKNVDDSSFQQTHLDKAVFDAYLFQVYGSENADIAAEELMTAMEDRGDNNTDADPHLNNENGIAENLLPTDAAGGQLTVEDEGGVNKEEHLKMNCVLPERVEDNVNNTDYSVGGDEDLQIEGALYPMHYNLDMISSAHFAAGQDLVAADPSSLFVLPNGQEINNNDANNNGVDANQLVPDQNVPPAPQPRVVNLESQVLDIVSHGLMPQHSVHTPVSLLADIHSQEHLGAVGGVVPTHSFPAPVSLLTDIQTQEHLGAVGGAMAPHLIPAPVSLLADIQTQERLGAVGGIGGALSSLPDIIKTSYCSALPYETCSRLGEELLRAYLQEMDTDCTILVGNQEFKCHRCILASRSNYFTAMLRGGWVESEGDKIVLECVRPAVVEQALLYIYGGVLDLTDACNVSELLVLSDMYGLEGLRDVISLHLRMINCHFFHKPCSQCIPGVIETLAITDNFHLEELSDRCRKWINKNFVKVWPTKCFAQLQESSHQSCCQAAIHDLQPHSVLDVIMDCDKLTTSLPRLKWTEPVLDLITLLMDSAMEFTSQNFSRVLSSERFIALGKSQAWSMSLLDTIFSTVIRSLPIDSICPTYLAVFKLVEFTQDKETCSWTEDFKEFLKSLLEKCKNYIRLYIHQVVHCQHWELLTKNMQEELLKSASYVCIDAHRGNVAPKLSSMNKKSVKQSLTKSFPASKNQSATKKLPINSKNSERTQNTLSLSRSIPKRNIPSSPNGSSGKESKKGTKLQSSSSIPRPIRNITPDKQRKIPVRKTHEGSERKDSVNVNNERTFQGMCDADTNLADLSDLCMGGEITLPLRPRSGSAGDLPIVRIGVSRSRSEELHLLRKGESHMFELLPILETKFTLPEDSNYLVANSF